MSTDWLLSFPGNFGPIVVDDWDNGEPRDNSLGVSDGSPFAGGITKDFFAAISAVLRTSDQTPNNTPDNSKTSQYLQGLVSMVTGADFYTDTGTTNTFEMTAIGNSVLAPNLRDGQKVCFYAANANTGNSTIDGTALFYSGVVLPSGLISAGDFIVARYDLANTRYNIVNFTKISDNTDVSDTPGTIGQVLSFNALGVLEPTDIGQQYKIGDIFETTIDYADTTAVNVALGYGAWEKFAEGKVSIGDGSFTDARGENKVFSLGDADVIGEYNHVQVLGEIGTHSHTSTMTEDGGNTAAKPERGDGAVSGTMTTDTTGSSDPMNNMMPYEVSAKWKRIA